MARALSKLAAGLGLAAFTTSSLGAENDAFSAVYAAAATNYTVDTGEGIVRENGPWFGNRPLYGNHDGLLVMAGDRPFARHGAGEAVHGQLAVGWQASGAAQPTWFHTLDKGYTARFRGGAMTWTVRPPGGAVVVNWTVAPLADALGTASELTVVSGAAPGDRLVLLFGGAYKVAGGRPLGWTFDGAVNQANLAVGLQPDKARGTRPSVTAKPSGGVGAFRLDAAAQAGVVVDGVLAAPAGANVTISVVDFEPSPSVPVATAATPAVPVAHYTPASQDTDPSTGRVVRWRNEAGGGGGDLAPPAESLGPAGAASGGNWTSFDRSKGTALVGNLSLPAAKTIVAVVRPGATADVCCSGVATAWDPAAEPKGEPGMTTNGIAVMQSHGGGAVYTVLDFAGENDAGVVPVQNAAAVLSVVFNESSGATLFTNGCVDIDLVRGGLAHPSTLLAVGDRASDPTAGGNRHFDGAVAEVVVFDAALGAAERAQWEAQLGARYGVNATGSACAAKGQPFVLASVDATAGGPVHLVLNLSDIRTPPPNPSSDPAAASAAVLAALDRTDRFGKRVVAKTPSVFLNAAMAAAAAAVDGLFRSSPPVYLHGAMAWDVALVGWRSQYAATCFGWTENVAAEGAFFFANQVNESDQTECFADAARKLTQADPKSRFYGKGRVKGGDGMYDMQSQMFDQQVHMWRWTGNTTHEGPLRSALELHAEWAEDCFDADGDGLYTAYINTWPTDSVWFNGGPAPEESGYMHRAHEALRDMAVRAGDAAAAAKHAAAMARVAAAFRELWIPDRGHPAAYREEIGHQRLRPDAWLYSVCVPIEAGLLTAEEAAQALHYTEWGLQRDSVACTDADGGGQGVCGERVWTSCWVPSIWSVREFWPGDNYMLALSYFKTGLPDDGWRVLWGNLNHDMYNWLSPGVLGASNGGIDFNDIVHPFGRAVVEGLCGFEPNYPNGTVTFAPQFPTSWPSASFETAFYTVSLNNTQDAAAKTTAHAWRFGLAQPAALEVRLPVRALAVLAVTVNGKALSPNERSVEIDAGFGQGVLVLRASGAKVDALAVDVVTTSNASPFVYAPSVSLNATRGAVVTLAPQPGFHFLRVSDPQAALAGAAVAPGKFSATVVAAARTNATRDAVGRHSFFLYSQSTPPCGPFGCTPVVQTVKLRVTDPAAEARKRADAAAAAAAVAAATAERSGAASGAEARAATFKFADVSSLLNANVSDIYYPEGGYVSPRPSTCGARIGTDGYSAWTFTYGQGNVAPRPDLSLVPSLLTASGALNASGVLFDAAHLRPGNGPGGNSIAFTSMWDNYPCNVTVTVPPAAAGDVVFALVAGSTNPMQTLLANARLHYRGAGGEALGVVELTPPLNFWSLSSYGGTYYDYTRDWFCLPKAPPAQVALGGDNHAMVVPFVVPKGAPPVAAVTLETLSLEVVVGLYAVSVAEGAAT